ncbi:unnamed protein product [Symbiodinium sp. CCMP2592]|nr:unnamed protein product [Symbiodinium sp. CCMP2592]
MDAMHLHSSIRSCHRNQDWRKALHLLQTLQPRRLLEEVSVCAAMSMCTRASYWSASLALFAGLVFHLDPDPVTFSAALAACSSGSQWTTAILLLHEMAEIAVQADAICFNSAISACETVWQVALWLLRSITVTEVRPNCITFSACINACPWTIAMHLFDQMRSHSIQSNAVTLNTVMKACASQWQIVLEVMALFPDMALRSDMVTYSTAISACEKAARWQHAAVLLQEMLASRVEANVVCYNAAISAFGAGGRWELSLQHCRELLAASLPDQVSCGAVMDAAAKGGRWDWTLTVLSSMGRWRLAPDIFNYNIAISEASHWEQSLQLQGCRESGRAPNRITYSNALTTLAAYGCWKFALCMSRRMQADRCHSEIAYGAALNACEKGLQWRASLMMLRWIAQQGMETNEICYRAVISASENEDQWPVALLLLLDPSTPAGGAVSSVGFSGSALSASEAVQASWRSSRIQRHGGELRILPELSEDQLQRLSLQELSILAWSMASSGDMRRAWHALLREVQARLQSGEERRLPLRALATLSWSFASAPLSSQASLCEVLPVLQRELASRVTVLKGREAISSSTDMLEVLWASSFVGCLQPRYLPAVWNALQRVARALDSTAHLPPPASTSPGRLDPLAPELQLPRVVLQLPDRLVVHKPPGWQVDESGDASGLPLSQYVQKLCNKPIHYDESHQRGFLHRLDVPSSGMILVASTFSAYYDLQFQLSAGMLIRDYAVQSHGWCGDRGMIRASVAWADTGSRKDSPSRVIAGENSETHLKVLLHSIHMGRALSFMAIRIGTGRKHQIRVHTAHVGHATVSDGLYSTAETYSGDQDCCQRIFLHRYHLAFCSQALHGEEFEARDALPPDLQDCLQAAQEKKSDRVAEASCAQIFHALLGLKTVATWFVEMSADVRKYSCRLDAGDHPRAITVALKNLAGCGADLSDVLLSMRTATIEANVYHYNTAISTCQGPLWQSALHLLLRMSLHLVPADAVSQNAAMAAVGPLWQRSANLFRDSDKEGVAFNSMLSSLSKVGNWELGQSALKEMRCSLVQADHISFTACLDASGRADQWRRSWFLLKELQTSLRADVVAWNCAISSGRAWQRALEVVAAIPWHALQPDTVSYDSAISRCTGKWQHASSLMGSSGLRASLVTYHAAMTAFEAPGWCFALNFLQGIGSERLLPEVLTYNSAAAACQKALRWLQASGVLRSMSVSGLQGDSYTCSAVLGACRDSWALAVELVSGMCRSDLPPNAIVFNALASACGLAGQWQLALRSLDAVGDCFTYAAAISACEKAHEWQRALWLLYQMPGVCLKADAVCFAAAISACEKAARWQHAAVLLQEMLASRVEANVVCYNAAISAFGAGGRWELSLQHCRELLAASLPDQVSCGAVMDAAAKGGRWDWTLTVLSSMGRWRLAPDIFNYNIAISEASHWEQSLQLQGCRESGRAPNRITYSNALTTLAAYGCWKFALCMSRRMLADRCHSEIAYGAALNACEKGLQWRASLMMLRWIAQQGMETNEICYRAVISASENEDQWPVALLLLLDPSTPAGGAVSSVGFSGSALSASEAVQASWRSSRIQRHGGELRILPELSEDQLQRLSLQELSILAWSMASSGDMRRAWHALLREVQARLQSGEERRLPLRALATLSWSFASAPLSSQASLCEVLPVLQRELASRVTVLKGREAISSSTDMLEVLWASSFVGCLQPRYLPAVWNALQRVARALDSTAHLPPPASTSPGRLDPLAPELQLPRVVLQLPDRLVVHKPPGWQVDESGDASGLPLSQYVQKLCNKPIHYDESHQRGFLHRLDVPSSGMILVASTFSAYYDLQFQLSAGMLIRDYAVQSHGWCGDRGMIRASVAWADTGSRKDSPSRVIAGENSETHLKVLLHSIHMGRALSFMAIRIGTGRKHQIRVHTAHVGHATVSDGLYSTAETYSCDQDCCQRIFLHRYHLAFCSQALHGEEFEARDALPPDLQDCLQAAQVVRPCPQRVARSAPFASLPPWHLCSQLTRKRRVTGYQKQLVLRSSMHCLVSRQSARVFACHFQLGGMPCADAMCGSSCDDCATRLQRPPG